MGDLWGHIISEKGISVDPDKIASVKSWPVPKLQTHYISWPIRGSAHIKQKPGQNPSF